MSEKLAGENAGVVFVLGVAAILGWATISFLAPDDWKIKYCARYFVSFDNVHVNDRPTSCDWSHAPLGDKACHYEKIVTTERWDTSKEGKPIYSYDDGKTWNIGTPEAGTKLPTENVFVSWQRRDDP